MLVFRLGDEWLALPVGVLVEVTRPRPPHRVPHRGGLLAGVVNIRGELHLCVRFDLLLGDHRERPGLGEEQSAVDCDPAPVRGVGVRGRRGGSGSPAAGTEL